MSLKGGRNYNYLRTNGTNSKKGPRENVEENQKEWKLFEKDLQDIGMDPTSMTIIKKVLAAILLLGEIEFEQDDEGFARVGNQDVVESSKSKKTQNN